MRGIESCCLLRANHVYKLPVLPFVDEMGALQLYRNKEFEDIRGVQSCTYVGSVHCFTSRHSLCLKKR